MLIYIYIVSLVLSGDELLPGLKGQQDSAVCAYLQSQIWQVIQHNPRIMERPKRLSDESCKKRDERYQSHCQTQKSKIN